MTIQLKGRYRVRSGTGHEVVTTVERLVLGYRDHVIRWMVIRVRDGALLPKPRREEDLLPLPERGTVHALLHGLDHDGEERRAEGVITVAQWEQIARILRG